ncbi:DUF4974 domain-containing protein [Mariniphaga sediminis]|jgi:ferric-dicitrate binding protein FerR (iron transport regulator)|uniref:DUF4974 domain-containing protein n=1 Tax=Mariniphaga sediminis TaxID=1628158 RepID=A0A399D7S8_9BACT|nr:FecR family protein [Mariniphaga sediminis]RIH66380.1 DUF4974 domain-containing protein [Mariniphaga sediminis]
MEHHEIEKLLPAFFEGTLDLEERERVEQWKAVSEENRQVFADSLTAWEGIEQLRLMRKYDPGKAIGQVNSRIESRSKLRILVVFQKVAAILLLPLLVATLYFATQKTSQKELPLTWHTLETPAGMRSEFILPDSTRVYLNSKTRLRYPLVFSNNIREVELTGEAYFEVAENKKVPFIVNTGRVNIEVTGTEFLATNYLHENVTEIVLVEGNINLFQGNYSAGRRDIVQLKPGQKALLKEGDKRMVTSHVDVEKYLAWKDGILMFRDDSMPEVVRRLNRWFNVDIQLTGSALKNYVYTATFEDESLIQVLDLLKISAPIDYTIKQREIKTDKTFSKMEIEIKQK